MTAANFDRALALVLVSEGGYVDNARDPGGATNLGITIATLGAWLGHTATIEDVKSLTKSEAGEIYHTNYWSIVNGDALPAGVDYAVFDFAVNSGPRTAAKFLQRSLSVTDDGDVGPETLNAIGQGRPADLINALCDKRLAYLRSLGTWVDFGAGWSARVAQVRADALRMAPPLTSISPAPVPLPPKPAASAPATPATEGTTSMNANFFKGLFGSIMGIAGVLMPMVPPQYQPLIMAIIGIFGGAHGITSAATNK